MEDNFYIYLRNYKRYKYGKPLKFFLRQWRIWMYITRIPVLALLNNKYQIQIKNIWIEFCDIVTHLSLLIGKCSWKVPPVLLLGWVLLLEWIWYINVTHSTKEIFLIHTLFYWEMHVSWLLPVCSIMVGKYIEISVLGIQPADVRYNYRQTYRLRTIPN